MMLLGDDAPDLVVFGLRVPEIAVRASCDAPRLTVGCRKRELDDGTAGSDAPNLPAIDLREPEIAIWSRLHEDDKDH